ncbi:DNA-directed RNA polymerase subunit F [archaeon]|nr:DNA-directed RNA polymerase subunit F [archaeon]|tara:strand:+ start:3072 stop:3413 length:342 start_codon:yes stop_codon:yes gene_type:complete
MPHLELISETPLSIPELKEQLQKVKKRDEELSPRANKTLDYLIQFSKLSPAKLKELKKKIEDLKIPRLKERHICKAIDVHPKDIDSLKIIFSGENIQPKQEDLNKILAILKAN